MDPIRNSGWNASVEQIEALWKAVHAKLHEIGESSGITWSEYRLLRNLPRNVLNYWDGRTPKQLAEAYGCSTSQISALLDSCERKGLISRKQLKDIWAVGARSPSRVDGRQKQVRLDWEGSDAVKEFASALKAFEDEDLPKVLAAFGLRAEDVEASRANSEPEP